MANKASVIERLSAINAFKALCPAISHLGDMPQLIDEAAKLGNEGLDRFSILHIMLERRLLAPDSRVAGRYMACLQRRHTEAAQRLAKIGERTDINGPQFDLAKTEENALHNAIIAMVEEAGCDMRDILISAGLSSSEADALLTLRPTETLTYDAKNPFKNDYANLMGMGLVNNVKLGEIGSSYSVCLMPAGEVLWRLVLGIRKVAA